MSSDRTFRAPVTKGLLLVALAVLGLWTLRAAAPEPPGLDEQITRHHLPISGADLFELTLLEGHTSGYAFSGDLDCVDDAGQPVLELKHDDVLYCASKSPDTRVRLRVDSAGPQHRLVLDGLLVAVPEDDAPIASMGLARSVDVVFPVPGMGARHLVLSGPKACGDDDTIRACVENGGLRGSLIVDRSLRDLGEGAPLVREAPSRGVAVPIADGDRVWAGHVPFLVQQLRRDELGMSWVELRVPRAGVDSQDWQRAAGDRRWMSLELPSWPLARLAETDEGWERDGEASFSFHSREQQFSTSPLPWAWDMHLTDQRIEWQEEEQLQSLIDHELLCMASSFDGGELAPNEPFPVRFVWNLETGRGCDGERIAAAPLTLHRLATEWAHDRARNEQLASSARQLAQLPDQVPNPAELAFVFDWTRIAGTADELAIVPTRLLGVRPLSTRNGPRAEPDLPSIEDGCDLAESGFARPPISVRKGTASPYLRVVESDTAVPVGARLLLASDSGSICVGNTVPDRTKLLGAGVAALGHVGLSKKDFQFDAAAPVQHDATTCMVLSQQDGVWTATKDGTAPLLLERATELGVTETNVGAGSLQALQHQDRLWLSGGDHRVVLSFEAPPAPDVIAFSEATDDAIERRYPYGRDLAAVLGVHGVIWGGLESFLEPSLWAEAEEAWQDSCGEETGEVAGVELTLSGDMQRIVYSELAAMHDAKAAGGLVAYDGTKRIEHDILRMQAVLLDSRTGDVLAVANTPGFDPNAKDALRREQDALKQRDGKWQAPPEYDNQAFRRNKQIGSVYKLVTSYGLARSNLLDVTPPNARCFRIGFRESERNDDATDLVPELRPRVRTDESLRCSAGEGTGGYGFDPSPQQPDHFEYAFKNSSNPFFSLGAMALAPRAGLLYSAAPSTEVSAPGIMTRHVDLANIRGVPVSRTIHEWVTRSDFSTGDDLGTANGFLEALILTGHRYHYGYSLRTQTVDSIGTTTFPTSAEMRWLPGVRQPGFRYPSVTGPELYGVDRRERRTLALSTRRGVDENTYTLQDTPVEPLASYAKLAYGMGGLESNALALAVIGSAAVDGSVVSPDVVVGASEEERRVFTESLLTQAQRRRIEQVMKETVKSGTGGDYFLTRLGDWDGVGTKTGTFRTGVAQREMDAPVSTRRRRTDELMDHACGRVGGTGSAVDWAYVTQRAPTSAGWQAEVRERLQDGWVPPAGFAAGSQECGNENPGRAGVSADLGDADHAIDGGTWLDAYLTKNPPPASKTLHLPGSSLITVVFDGLDDQGTGRGLVLAVVADGHRDAAKRASVQILIRLRQYLQLVAATEQEEDADGG
ncbi:MAG: hypothetical protein GY913_03645 [Proteobacteria bacterium]|nr:hypothetical protein [Pseudomonadota bacterium]MCP4915995.1 hypothetical protein [Pseudomonadota bacterium]